ncbi:MAG: hypothetical protein ACK5LM_03825 [Lactovum sp.]
MKTTKATEEIYKAKVHLLKAKKVMSRYVFEYQPNSFKKINKLIEELDNFSIEVNADSKDVQGMSDPGLLSAEQISRQKYK